MSKPTVLVAIIRAGPKNWAFGFYPKFATIDHYTNKQILLIDETNYPDIAKPPLGELICAKGRNFAVQYARKHNFDYIYFQDLDLEPSENMIETLLASGSPLIGSLVAARGNANQIIGHSYKNRETLERVPLYLPELQQYQEVDGIGGCSLLVHRSIFSEVDYSGYTGPDTFKGRFTADDEYFQLKVYEKLKIRPCIEITQKAWHYDSNGYRYQLLGKKEKYI